MKSVEVAGVEISTCHFINGERIASAQTLANTSPIDGQFLGDFSRGGSDEVDLAVKAARDAFPAWRDLGPLSRAEKLERLAKLIEENIETLAQIETLDNGALLRSHRKGVMPRAAANIRFFAEWQSMILNMSHLKLVVTLIMFRGIHLVLLHSLLHGMHP